MKKSVVAALCLAVLLSDLPVSAATLDALPEWENPHMVVHAENLSGTMARLGKSFLLDALLDVRRERAPLLQWLGVFPAESVSLVRGLLLDDEDTFQGAVRLVPSARKALLGLDDAVAAALRSKDASESLSRVFFDLLNVPEPLRETCVIIDPSEPDDGEKTYELDIGFGFSDAKEEVTVHVSLGMDGNEPVLLIGSDGEHVERARAALSGKRTRLKVVRRDTRHGSFVQLNDDADGRLIRDILDGLSVEALTPVFAELSFGLSEGEIVAALRHNVFEALVGSAVLPAPALSPADPGPKSGGAPWFSGLASLALSPENILDLAAFVSDSDREETRLLLKEQGLDPSDLAAVLRSFGVVLGGRSTLRGAPMPGGYAFLSGAAESMRALSPHIRAFVESSPDDLFKFSARPGWDLFCTVNAEKDEEPVAPMVFGVKDGTLLMGSLAPEALDEVATPEPEGSDTKGKRSLLRVALDVERVCDLFIPFLSAASPEALKDLFEVLDAEDLPDSGALSGLLRSLGALQEVRSVTLNATGWDDADLTVKTGDVDYRKVWELTRLSRKPAIAAE